MDSIRPSTFQNGYWMWDEVNNGLLFVRCYLVTLSMPITVVIHLLRDGSPRMPSLTNVSTPIVKATHKQITHEMKFRETVDNLEQIRFRRYHQRRCKPTEPQVITLQDIKDVALYTANIKDLTPEFIKYFHIPTMDRFLRSLIVYFQYYIQVWEHLVEKRSEIKRKLYQPLAVQKENMIRDDLADLRAMVAREYCFILIGAHDARKFHHMNNKNNVSISDKDRRLFETLLCMAVRVVWIALQRKHLSLIELEMNRMLRTEIFNLVTHRARRGVVDLARTANEERILSGLANTEERKLLHRSLITKELILGDHDYRMLIIGIRQFEPTDERLEYLEIALAAPEEHLIHMGATVGLLGIPREEYDAMLMNVQRTTKRKQPVPVRTTHEFKLPLKAHHSDEEMPTALPKNDPNYKDTPQKIRARKTQCAMWIKTIEKAAEGREMSVLDLSTSQSHAILTSRTSIMSAKN